MAEQSGAQVEASTEAQEPPQVQGESDEGGKQTDNQELGAQQQTQDPEEVLN